MTGPSKPETRPDAVIVGGGLVGLAAALSLAPLGLRVTLLETRAPDLQPDTQTDADRRTLVINPAAQAFWQGIGVWTRIAPLCAPIERVHVTQQGHFGGVVFDRLEMNLPQLGHVIDAALLARELWQLAAHDARIELVAPARVAAVHNRTDHAEVQFKLDSQAHTEVLHTALVLAADGAQSPIRTALELPVQTHDYGKSALVFTVVTDRPHLNTAHERLTEHGPVALIPGVQTHQAGLVWTVDRTQVEALMALNEAEFMREANRAFGLRLGRFQRIGRRASFPLHRMLATQQHQGRVLLLGNAAHALSPVSAQGLNLAVRGVRRLQAMARRAVTAGIDLGDPAGLAAYQAQAMPDQMRTLDYTDGLMRWFALQHPLVNAFRSTALLAIDNSPLMKQRLYRLAGGLLA